MRSPLPPACWLSISFIGLTALGCQRDERIEPIQSAEPAAHGEAISPPAAAAAAEEPTRELEPEGPRHASVEVFINNHRYGPTNGCTMGFSPQRSHPALSNAQQTITCGHPGAVSKLLLEYLGTDEAGDRYRFERTYPAGEPNAQRTEKEVVYTGEELVLFEDDTQRIVLRPPSG